MGDFSKLAALSLVSEKPKQRVAEALGLSSPTLDEFISWVAREAGVDEDRAKEIILNSPILMKVAFILA